MRKFAPLKLTLMKIALVHYRYFPGDGPERYFFNIKEILEKNGHVTAPFSIHNSRNLPEPRYSRYFLDAVDDEVHFGDKTKLSPAKAVKSLTRMFWSTEARRKVGAFLDDFQPDVVYIMQYHNKISPSILGAARKRGIPVVHRISDFQYMCPNALFFSKGKVCEECLSGNPMVCVKNRCVHGSAAMSAMKLGAKMLHDRLGVTDRIDAFVVPSSFTLGKLAQYGIPAEKLHHIPTFYNGVHPEGTDISYEPYFLYIGRIAEQKGMWTLIKSFAKSGLPLKIIGTSADGLENQLKKYLAGHNHRIEFLGFMPFERMVPYLRSCLATIVPSEWYDNFPNVILESFAFSKPVIASRIGSLLETVEHGVTGLTFTPGDPDALTRAATEIAENPALAVKMGGEAAARIDTLYSPQTHYSSLIALFSSLKS